MEFCPLTGVYQPAPHKSRRLVEKVALRDGAAFFQEHGRTYFARVLRARLISSEVDTRRTLVVETPTEILVGPLK